MGSSTDIMEQSELRYNLESWEYDFMVKHLLSNEEILHYDEGEKELLAETERSGSTVYFYTRRDVNVTWFSVLSMNEGDELGENYLESMVEHRLESVAEEARETLGIEYSEEDVNAVAGI
jgi:hypothetical protein